MNALMDMYGGLNFTVLGFPCNQFGLQAPEENHETLNVLQYVRPGGGFLPKFPIFSRIEETLPFVNPVIGDIRKLYWSPIKANDIRWNFEKFLITADGLPYKRYDLHCPFEDVERDIAALLQGRHSS
ncbi:glutathione peroxidase 9 isoform X2 [Megalobrama amblycephala]|uniref:glutathione peroxidase 9 isoform X2 n=1 Tax=Megalobrama amblycephala TaxID=75352 RepID=UPI0020140D7F|nr:glutathione peroxidase 9 isoform X2 [Megalobrama amblycephala]